jgi:hypothetical protein
MARSFLDFFSPCDRVLLSPKVRFVTFPVSGDFGREQIKKCKNNGIKGEMAGFNVQTLENEFSFNITAQMYVMPKKRLLILFSEIRSVFSIMAQNKHISEIGELV